MTNEEYAKALYKIRRHRCARLGGMAVSQKPGHMAAIGRLGGLAVSKNRAWMAHLARLSAQSKTRKRREDHEHEAGATSRGRA